LGNKVFDYFNLSVFIAIYVTIPT